MDFANRSLIILSHQYGVVVRGIVNRLKGLGYRVEVISDRFEQIKFRAPSASLFIVYLPDDIMDDPEKQEDFSVILEMVSESGKDLIIIGEGKYHHELLDRYPEGIGYEWMNRPVDMDRLCSLVDMIFIGEKKSVTKKRILIVDDDPAYAKMVREWIKSSYRVDVVTAGMQAITFLLKLKEEEQVDMILLDYEMPIVDGPQVLQMLRQEPATAHIPVIFLTGVGTKEAVGRVMGLKPDGYILKSTTREDLLKFLNKKLIKA